MFEFDQIFSSLRSAPALGLPQHPVLEFSKLVTAATIGLVVTKVRKHGRGRPFPLPVEHAMVLLTLAGALMMIIIGDSLPRALGIAGAATIVRFRTPVDDPRDKLQKLSDELMRGGEPALRSVTWSEKKWMRD
jgi:hypothetical protein